MSRWKKRVSVPLQGTYLPYNNHLIKQSYSCSFRPLAGDLSSLLVDMKYMVKQWTVSVPLQGTYFPYNETDYNTDFH